MTRVFPRLVLAVIVLALGAGCRKSSAPAANKTVDAGAAATAPTGQAPGAPGLPGATVPPTDQAVEAAAKPVPAVLPSVVAKVNGEDIQKWELEAALKQA